MGTFAAERIIEKVSALVRDVASMRAGRIKGKVCSGCCSDDAKKSFIAARVVKFNAGRKSLMVMEEHGVHLKFGFHFSPTPLEQVQARMRYGFPLIGISPLSPLKLTDRNNSINLSFMQLGL